MWSILISQILAGQTYIYLTPPHKAALERRISDISIDQKPQISPGEVSSLLGGLNPQKCSQNPTQRQKQTICLWVEGGRKVEVYYDGGETAPQWTFQRWKASGAW